MPNRFRDLDRDPAGGKGVSALSALSALSKSARRAVILLLEDEPIGEAYVRSLGRG